MHAVGSGARRRCAGCGATWSSRSVRFCGLCGTPVTTSAGRAPAASGGRRVASGVVAGTALAAIVAVAVTTPTFVARGPLELRTGDDQAVRLGAGPDGSSTAVDCRPARDHPRGCGPLILDARERAAALVAVADGVAMLRGTELEVVDLPAGTSRWRRPVLAERLPVRLHAAGALVLVVTGRELSAFDVTSGRREWHVRLSNDPTDATDPPLLWDDGTAVLVLTGAGRLSSYELGLGTPRWQRRDVGTLAVATDVALVVSDGTAVRGWSAAHEEPRWEQHRADVELRPQRSDRRHGGPLPLLGNAGLLDPVDGEVLPLPAGGPSRSDAAGQEVTLLLWWPGGGDHLTVRAYAAGGELRWELEDVPLPCCLTSVVPGVPSRIGLVAPGHPGVVLDLRTGARLATLERAGGSVESIVGDTALWRTSEGLVAEDMATHEVRLRARGSPLSLEPLLLEGPHGVLAVDPVVLSGDPLRNRGR